MPLTSKVHNAPSQIAKVRAFVLNPIEEAVMVLPAGQAVLLASTVVADVQAGQQCCAGVHSQ